ncbi:MAG: hypothetical protein AAFQ02_11610 [Bacteroidota bacterium]
MKFTSITMTLFISLLLFSCKPGVSDMEPLDLLSEDIPFSILAPAGVSTEARDVGIVRDITIQNDDWYSLQIYESEARSLDVSSIIAELKTEAKGNPFFSQMIEENEDGFIFERVVDDEYTNYDFRHVKIRGDKQYLIQTGLSRQYTLDQVKTLFKSVQ